MVGWTGKKPPIKMGHAKIFHGTFHYWLDLVANIFDASIVERRSNFNKTYFMYLDYTTCNNSVGVFIDYLCIIH